MARGHHPIALVHLVAVCAEMFVQDAFDFQNRAWVLMNRLVIGRHFQLGVRCRPVGALHGDDPIAGLLTNERADPPLFVKLSKDVVSGNFRRGFCVLHRLNQGACGRQRVDAGGHRQRPGIADQGAVVLHELSVRVVHHVRQRNETLGDPLRGHVGELASLVRCANANHARDTWLRCKEHGGRQGLQ